MSRNVLPVVIKQRKKTGIALVGSNSKYRRHPFDWKLLSIVAFFLTILIATPIIIHFTNLASTPQKTIRKFESSINNLDLDSRIECIEPRYQSVYKEALAMLSDYTDLDAPSLLQGFTGLFDFAHEATLTKVIQR